MRDHGEVFERIKSKTQQYELDKRKRNNRLQIVIAAVAFAALIGVSITAYHKLGKGTSTTPAGNSTPTEVDATSTPTEKLNPTEPIASPTPIDRKGRTVTIPAKSPDGERYDVPSPGQVVIGSESLNEALKLVSDDDYLTIRIVFALRNEEKLNGFSRNYDIEEYKKDPLYVQYQEDLEKWVKEKSQGDGESNLISTEPFTQEWKAAHTEEELQHLNEVFDKIARANEDFKEYLVPYDNAEIERLRSTGVNIINTPYGDIALMTKSQIREFQASEEYSYVFMWAQVDLNGTSGFTGVEIPEDEPGVWNVRAVGEYDGRWVYDLRGNPEPVPDAG